eukprot:TRINITY_DN42918_c0_g1_i1.p1 TRINITY_DN42918_c0_g1~~TRINITY_DN42918_c0_g1_i1.p1  ORF type:complete len:602 (+),score=103.81 TRINITY_DN42918_c0_g1_i1:60-1865(+)
MSLPGAVLDQPRELHDKDFEQPQVTSCEHSKASFAQDLSESITAKLHELSWKVDVCLDGVLRLAKNSNGWHGGPSERLDLAASKLWGQSENVSWDTEPTPPQRLHFAADDPGPSGFRASDKGSALSVLPSDPAPALSSQIDLLDPEVARDASDGEVGDVQDDTAGTSRRNRGLSGPAAHWNTDMTAVMSKLKRMKTSELYSDETGKLKDSLMRRHRLMNLWIVLDDPYSGTLAWLLSITRWILVVASIFVTVCQCTEPDALIATLPAAILETSFDAIFTMEFVCRLISAPSRMAYLKDPYNWSDILAGIALFFRAGVGFILPAKIEIPASSPQAAIQAALLFALPAVRLTKLLRNFESFKLLIDAFKSSFAALPVLFYTLGLIILVCASMIYLVEPRSSIPSIQHSLWFCLVTMSTVGYGDFSPKSTFGYVIVSMMISVSILFLAMPVGIIGNEFNHCWANRRSVLLISRTRRNMIKWGYSFTDLQVLFKFVDKDGSGEIELEEFMDLLKEMQVGTSRAQAKELFALFDDDENGAIDYREFLMNIFPFEYSVMQAKKKGDEEGDESFLSKRVKTSSLVRRSRLGKALSKFGLLRKEKDNPP